MSHAVHFRSSDGSTTFEPVGSLEDALARVEELRNEHGVSEVRVYREVPVTFRAYYKATVAEEGVASGPAADQASPPPAAQGSAPPADQAPTPPPAPAAPPPGAMPLSPPAPSANGRDDAADESGEGDDDGEARGGRGSLFSRG